MRGASTPRPAPLAALGLAALAAGCGEPGPRPAPEAAAAIAPAAAPAPDPLAPPAVPVRFTDVTGEAGIRFVHENGARGRKYLPETMGSGVAVLDYDSDGLPDLFLVNSMPWPEDVRGTPPTSALYRNLGNGTFADRTREAGLAVAMYGMGATAGDYDGDGDADLFVTCLGPDRLFRNDGGTFTDVTAASGISDDAFGSSATWLDHDRDGDLDLFVANYVTWSPDRDIYCTLDGKAKSYCTPESYDGASPRLWRNQDGRFTDVTAEAGLLRPTAKSLGVIAVDYDLDGWSDVIVANDTQPNYVFRNQGDGTFREVGMSSGIAFNENGVARGAMGIDAADYDGSGRPGLVIGNFSNEMLSLYHNEGHGLFVDASPASGVGRASLLTLAFGCFFLDFDRDGFTDIFVANGHVEDEIEVVQPQVRFAQPPHLFRNLGRGRFEDVAAAMGDGFAAPQVARGAAYLDYDRDGDLDLCVTQNGGPARLFRNDGGNANHWTSLRLRGRQSNRDALGATVRVVAGGRTHWGFSRAGSSYCSQSEPDVSFGLGAAGRIDRVEVDWPSGTRDVFPDVPVDRHVTLVEGGEATAAALVR